jgi:hypothetical protein
MATPLLIIVPEAIIGIEYGSVCAHDSIEEYIRIVEERVFYHRTPAFPNKAFDQHIAPAVIRQMQ